MAGTPPVSRSDFTSHANSSQSLQRMIDGTVWTSNQLHEFAQASPVNKRSENTSGAPKQCLR